MSGILRREKNCLNCGCHVEERFCTHCGQENLEFRIPFWKLLSHFIGDYFHFEHKFFNTLVPLVFKPGILTKSFTEGRRARFIHPFRLYIFISIVYFAVFFTTHTPSSGIDVHVPGDTVSVAPGTKVALSTGYSGLPFDIRMYEDSIKKLPENRRPSRFEDFVNRKIIKANAVGEKAFLAEFYEKFSHNIPKILFLFLPIVALLLKLLYIRKKKFYTEHFIFALHIHAFLFLWLLFYELAELALHIHIPAIWVASAVFVYVILAMKKVYEQSWMKTLLKFSTLSILYLASIVFVALVNIFIVILTI